MRSSGDARKRARLSAGVMQEESNRHVESPGQPILSETLRELLTRHGLKCAMEEQWVVPNNQLPAIRALWHPRETSGRLDVQVLMEKGLLLEECFAGIGTGHAAFADALNNFMVNSLHVLLSSLWGITDEEQVLSEQWNVLGRQFTATIGNVGIRTSAGVQVVPPKGLFEAIQTQICHETLPAGTHWFRTFFCNYAGQHTYEALRDNEPWEGGITLLKRMPWPETDGYYSFRNFIVLRSA